MRILKLLSIAITFYLIGNAQGYVSGRTKGYSKGAVDAACLTIDYTDSLFRARTGYGFSNKDQVLKSLQRINE